MRAACRLQRSGSEGSRGGRREIEKSLAKRFRAQGEAGKTKTRSGDDDEKLAPLGALSFSQRIPTRKSDLHRTGSHHGRVH